jgi:hypothetical protein
MELVLTVREYAPSVCRVHHYVVGEASERVFRASSAPAEQGPNPDLDIRPDRP